MSMQEKTIEQLNDTKNMLDDHIMNYLLQSQTEMANVFGSAPLVKSIHVDRFDWEVGDNKHRLHANIIFTIHHHVKQYSVEGTTSRLRDWLNAQNLPGVKSWYVHGFLNDRRGDNYANKNKREQKNDEIEQDADLTDELERLSIN